MLDTMPARQCICSPPDEPLLLELNVEIEAAQAVRCPLHGRRFTSLAPTIYRGRKVPQHLDPAWRKWRSPQYIKAMEASFPPHRWPAQEIVELDNSVRFVLNNGNEIYRIAQPPLVYDLDTGEPCGRIGRDGKVLPLS